MFKAASAVGVALMLVPGAGTKPGSESGSWFIDVYHSDAQLVTDGTTDSGRTKANFILGYARISGRVKLDDSTPDNSSVDFGFYPATSITPSVDGTGKFMNQWLSHLSSQTLVGFHSKHVVRMPDGKLQSTGMPIVSRIDRNVDVTPSEAYSGPVYGPPIIRRVSRGVAFVFDSPAADSTSKKPGTDLMTGSLGISREQFPQLLQTVTNTYWPALVQDEQCTTLRRTKHIAVQNATGKFLSSNLSEPPIRVGEDYRGPESFNAIVGNQLTILLHLRLIPRG